MNLTGGPVPPPSVFPPGTPLLALPSWRAPRVLLASSGGPVRRWSESAFYPATRSAAQLYRLALRLKAAAGCGEIRRAAGDRWALREFIEDPLPATASMALQTRPAGPAQKFTIELRDLSGAVIGYVKYGTEELARRRLVQEHAMLTRLPPGFGPTVLKFGAMGDGLALLLTRLGGSGVAAKLPMTADVLQFAKSLVGPVLVPLTAHPYVRAVRERVATRLDAVLEELAGRAWPVSFQHGDFAPWNLVRDRQADALRAFDWEFGTPEGLPYSDLAYFILQVALLVYSWPAVKSAIYATQWLQRDAGLGLTEREARALVRLAMFDAYIRGGDDGYADDHPIQGWRLRIWRGLW